MNVHDIASYLEVSPTQVRIYARKHFKREGRVWRFTDEEVKQLIIAFSPAARYLS